MDSSKHKLNLAFPYKVNVVQQGYFNNGNEVIWWWHISISTQQGQMAAACHHVYLVFNLKKPNDHSPTQNWPNHQLHGQTNHTVIRELIWAVFVHHLHLFQLVMISWWLCNKLPSPAIWVNYIHMVSYEQTNHWSWPASL